MMTGQESLYQAGTYPITIIGYVEGYEAEAQATVIFTLALTTNNEPEPTLARPAPVYIGDSVLIFKTVLGEKRDWTLEFANPLVLEQNS